MNALELRIAELEAEVAALKDQLEIEKAERVHFRDDVNKAKVLAHNLIVDDLMPDLKLCLKALRRDEPKVFVAAHRIDLILDRAEITVNKLGAR